MSLNGMRHVTFFPKSQNVNATELGHEYKAHSARILEMSFIQIQAKIYRVEMNPLTIFQLPIIHSVCPPNFA